MYLIPDQKWYHLAVIFCWNMVLVNDKPVESLLAKNKTKIINYPARIFERDQSYFMRPQAFSVSFPLPSSFVLPLLRSFNENLLSVPDFQAVQFSIFTFNRFATVRMMIAVFVTQIVPSSLEQDRGYDC